MKQLLLYTAVALTCITGHSQNKIPALIKAQYTFTEVRRHVDGHDFEDSNDMILYASPVGSRFYSPYTEQYDSLMATPGGRDKYKDMLSYAASNALIVENGGITFDRNKVDIPSIAKRTQVTKPDDEEFLTVIDYAAQEDFTYTVPLSDLQWELIDDFKTILGFNCQKAMADYHGRRWWAWFATDIPVSSGPWQLMGLPGLIMEAETDGGEYRFVITGLEQVNQPITPRPGNHSYTKVDRKSFRKLQWEICNNPEKAYPDGKTKIINKQESIAAQTAHDLIETDYH